MNNLMRQKADWYRPDFVQDSAGGQTIASYTLIERSVPVFIQPQDSATIAFNFQRGLETSHTIFTTAIRDWQRMDLLEYKGRDFNIVGVVNMLESNFGMYLNAKEYPSTAKKILSRAEVENQ